jgi:hypothetical protein
MDPEGLLKRLRSVAAERGVSMATVIREALQDKVNAHRPKPRSVGSGIPGAPTLVGGSEKRG